MADKFLTLLDAAKMKGNDAIIGLIEENLNIAPEAQLFPFRPIKGISFNGLIRTDFARPSFRGANEGTETKRSSYANKAVSCAYLDGQLELDVAVAQADDMGEAHALALEADSVMKGALLTIGQQIWYGSDTKNNTNADAKGFPGAVAVVDAAHVLDATGSTADTGSSVYGVKLGEKHVSLVGGKDTVFDIGEWRKQRVTRDAKHFEAWINALQGWIGAQWIDKNALCRIKKLTAQAGKGLTDDLGYELLSQLPVGSVPDYWFMSRRSRRQLQKSRATATNNDSNPVKYPPTPTEMCGIPIIVTDSIKDTEHLSL